MDEAKRKEVLDFYLAYIKSQSPVLDNDFWSGFGFCLGLVKSLGFVPSEEEGLELLYSVMDYIK